MRNIDSSKLLNDIELILNTEYYKSLGETSVKELNYALSKAALKQALPAWKESEIKHSRNKRAYYLSAEFLMGRAIFNNLYSLGVLDQVKELLNEKGVDLNALEDVEDDALGNGGLGRLAACFLDSAASTDIPLDGYGIRYKYGLFKQSFENGFQNEMPDNWQVFRDPWSIRKDEEKVIVSYADGDVLAVPYDMPIFGYKTDNINTLRLWQSEALEEFNFKLFNDQKYDAAVKQRNEAENISMVLYPNDDTEEGKKLRLKQQYFFCSATLQDIIKKYKKNHADFSEFSKCYAIQLNDTHPVVSIAELIRLLVDNEDVAFEEALAIAKKTFAYTNHTIMAEALEKWNVELFKSVIPRVFEIIEQIAEVQKAELIALEKNEAEIEEFAIIHNDTIHMARLAIYSTFATNGVAKLHTEILKHSELNNWYTLYPERFQNKTNGITQRRWMGLCNDALVQYLSSLNLGDFIKDLSLLKGLEKYADNKEVLEKLSSIKLQNKRKLSDYIMQKEGVAINPEFIFDIQVKRMHEYKRQLLNAFSIMDIYLGLKDGSIKNFHPTAFIFGAKAAPGYFRAKGIIKYINELAKLINNDPEVKDKLMVHFVTNYNVSYAEKLIPAANVSEQISTAGTEASGTGNMKFMLNGAVTLGTYDGANVEIVEKAGEENNFIFGARVEEINSIKESYDAKALYNSEPRIKRVVDTLIDGTLCDDNTGMFKELYDSILDGASWHKADNYFVLHDFKSYVDAKLAVNKDYQNPESFVKKCLFNIANAGDFSSDRTIREYAKEIWKI